MLANYGGRHDHEKSRAVPKEARNCFKIIALRRYLFSLFLFKACLLLIIAQVWVPGKQTLEKKTVAQKLHQR